MTPAKGFDLPFAEGGQHAAAKAADKSLGPSKADAVALIAAAVEHFDSFIGHHPHEFLFTGTFIIMVAQHGDDGNTQAHQRIEQGMHFFGLAIVSEVAGDDQHICFIAHMGQGSRMRS